MQVHTPHTKFSVTFPLPVQESAKGHAGPGLSCTHDLRTNKTIVHTVSTAGRDEAGSKWPPVYTTYRSSSMKTKQTNAESCRLLTFTILLLNPLISSADLSQG